MAATKNNEDSIFFPLDHGGIIYPYTARSKWNQVFRLEAVLDEKIDVQNVRAALLKLRSRFPWFYVVLTKRNHFYALESTMGEPDIVPEIPPLCRPFDLKDETTPLFRVTYDGNRLGLELFHSIADGYGASVFLKNLIACYYRENGLDIPAGNGVFAADSMTDDEESADSFLDIYNEQGGHSTGRSEKSAYQLGDGKATKPLEITTFIIPANVLKGKSKVYGTTVTQFITAIYAKALCQTALLSGIKKDIKIEIPMNLRKRFGSDTLRNFSLYFNTSVKPELADEKLEEVLAVIKPQFEEGTSIEKLRNDIYTNVKQAEMFAFRHLPNKVKKGILKVGSSIYGERLFTSPLSNLGVFDLPEELKEHVVSVGFIIGQTLKNTIYSAAITYNNNVYWTVSSVVDSQTEKNLEEILKACELPVEIVKR